ncbi:SDR family NAD(P)-dependent oxidoreductase [Actinomadura sp. NTSP31]|uniref:SDR family NAD(P)-dependent oxidoreductase n=1 Tax=Actinomadura sp. NTSP31 TaxID=1735447 RepID=UPI0035BF9744
MPRPLADRPIDRFRLDGRTVVVTGGASGLGQTFAEALADAGARVAVFDRDPMDETAELLGDRGLTVHADLTDPDQVRAAVDRTLEWSDGEVDALVNNAGIASVLGKVDEVTVEDFDRVLSVNLRSMFLTTKALLPALIDSGRGSVINFSSYLGLVGLYPDFPVTAVPYASSKAGVVGFTRQLAVEYGRDQIRANVVAPGWHPATNLAREYSKKLDQAGIDRLLEWMPTSVPMGRVGDKKEIAGLVLYLASDASTYLTGQVIAHDGGITAA